MYHINPPANRRIFYYTLTDLPYSSMLVTLTIIRYKTWQIPLAFLAMAWFRFPLYWNRRIHFYKLMGSGKNGTFDKVPDLLQWAILLVHAEQNDRPLNASTMDAALGKSISRWLRWWNCETYTLFLKPLEGHGLWDRQQPFGALPLAPNHEGPVGTLTRATIRVNKLNHFWKHVAPVANQMVTAKGYITSFGIGEVPWIKQATFSIWKSKDDMKNFAYGMKVHAEVVKKTRAERWYSEDLFVRFAILKTLGTLRGKDPLQGIL